MTDQEKITALRDALESALSVINDYLDYEHNGDPWTEDARTMGEMEIDDYGKDGRMEAALEALAMTAEASEPSGEPVAWRTRYRSEPGMVGHYPWTYTDHKPRSQNTAFEREALYTHPATKQASPRNFCPDCGKRTPPGSIHTCTPPADSEAALQALSDQSQEFTATRRAFDQSALEHYAARVSKERIG